MLDVNYSEWFLNSSSFATSNTSCAKVFEKRLGVSAVLLQQFRSDVLVVDANTLVSTH